MLQGGRQVEIQKGDKSYLISNANVVPYNAKLLLKYDCHINVEICSTIRSVKYLYKYVYKGNDRTMVRISNVKGNKSQKSNNTKNVDEIKQYVDCRYISSIEAAYRLLEFNMHGRYPSVLPLMVHLPDEQFVMFDVENTVEQLKNAIAKSRKTTLQAWFDNNAKEKNDPLSEEQIGYDADGNLKPRGPELLYSEYPKYYKFEKGKFIRRKGGYLNQIGRMHTAHPSQGQRWYLRILLTHVKGATSHLDLLTYQNADGKTQVFNCFKKRCAAEGLLETDDEWDATLKEASLFKSPVQLRRLFAMIVKECRPHDVPLLFNKYKDDMIEDMEYKCKNDGYNRNQRVPQPVLKQMYNAALYEICIILEEYNVNLEEHDIKKPDPSECYKAEAKEIINERKYNQVEAKQEYELKYSLMNERQRLTCDKVINSIYNENMTDQNSNLFFIDAPGGTVCKPIH